MHTGSLQAGSVGQQTTSFLGTAHSCNLRRAHRYQDRRSGHARQTCKLMATQLSSVYPFLKTDADVTTIVDDAVIWANQHGLVVAYRSPTHTDLPERAIVHAPLAPLPIAFPRERFLRAKEAQPLFNLLVDAVAQDEAWLEQVLAGAAQAPSFQRPSMQSDGFTRRLLHLLRSTRDARRQQQAAGTELVLGIHRSDYMLDAPSGTFLQVELNTISSSFASLASLMSQLHQYMASRLDTQMSSRLPSNPAIDKLPAAIAAAHHAFGMNGSVVVMVVQPRERNAYDQQWLQLRLWEAHGIRTRRLTMAEVAQQCRLQPDGTPVLVADDVPVSVFYFRAGYTPDDYFGEEEWAARDLMERSSAAKCPTVAYQLAGSKKVQQELASANVLERFLSNSSAAELGKLRELFAGLWSLDDPASPETKDVIAAALADPDAFVLKPQREGGGNNLYGNELRGKLQSGSTDLSAYILMQKIRPPPQISLLAREGAWQQLETLSELGIYGTFLRRGRAVLLNEEVGHLVRTKASDSNEGGVAAGFAVLDSPVLMD